MQLQFENRIGLFAGKWLFRIELGSAARRVDVNLLAAKVEDQVFARLGTVGAAANDDDYVVEMIERRQIAFENVLAVFGFSQQIRRAAPNHFHPVIDEMLDGFDQPQL